MRIVHAIVAALLTAAAWSGADSQEIDLQEAPLEDVWPALSEPRLGDLDAMTTRGEIRVLTTFTLGSYFIESGQQRGTVYELSLALEQYAREHLGNDARRLRITVIPVRRDQLLPHLLAGHGDIAFANLTITPERSQLVDFSYPFTNKTRELLVTAPGVTGIEKMEDLAGREVVVPAASSYFESIVEVNRKLLAKGLAPIKITESDPRLEVEDILELMDSDLLPMTVADNHRLGLWSQVFKNITVHEDIAFREGASIALAIRKESPQLKKLLDGFVRENRVGTLLTNILLKKYGQNTGWVKSALDDEPTRRLEQLAGLFRTYGSQYDIDWLMLASFSFQESGFRQDARSEVGAIGVMQVMPSTAADRAVAIDNIEVLENNVHAGTKYLAVLRSDYFADEELDPTEQMLFTMAAYNAGPNRINRLRGVAATRGLDPNVWFNNVELVVAAQVGRETTNYVSNIYRYYIVYKRALATKYADELVTD
ncbi:MAG: transporter substrate-binding domain-containing protein [Proteobacteria bacterium]|nr:transporter substrate-binding domain-containing protein [Pseudomonadota bacterium]MDA1064043.1 transporter substrate-binding domain-containing protein [Pseudomonadota bacterium]